MFLLLRSCKEVLNEKTNAAKTNLKNDPKENETKNRGRRSGEGFLERTSRQALEKEFANKWKGIIIPTETREKREEGLESVEGGDLFWRSPSRFRRFLASGGNPNGSTTVATTH